MTKREELELILTLLRKYDLPLSPILEYAIREKMEECPEEEFKEQREEYPSMDEVNNKKEQSLDKEEVESAISDLQDKDKKHGDRKGKPWTPEEEELITLFFNQGNDSSFIAEKLGRTEIAIKARLAKLGLIEYTYEKEPINTDSVDASDEIEDKRFSEKNKDESDDISSQFSVKIGDKLRLFPSQLVGKVIKLRIDKKGHNKIVVQSDNGTIEETYDSKYLYQKVYEKKTDCSITNQAKRERIQGYRVKDTLDGFDSLQDTRVRAVLGDWILWKTTEEIGKVIAFRNDELGIRKMLVRKKNGYEIEIVDHPYDYDIILNKQKVATYEALSPINAVVPPNNENQNNNEKSRLGGVKVGDWIKSQYFVDKCKVIKIESIGPTLEKLIVEFKDGHQDWVIDNPEFYRIEKNDI